MMRCIIDTRANHTIGFDLQARALQHRSHARCPTIASEPSDRRDNTAAVLLLFPVTHAELTLPEIFNTSILLLRVHANPSPREASKKVWLLARQQANLAPG